MKINLKELDVIVATNAQSKTGDLAWGTNQGSKVAKTPPEDRTYDGDQRAKLIGSENQFSVPGTDPTYGTYVWSETTWAADGTLTNGVAEAGFERGESIVPNLGINCLKSMNFEEKKFSSLESVDYFAMLNIAIEFAQQCHSFAHAGKTRADGLGGKRRKHCVSQVSLRQRSDKALRGSTCEV